MTPIHELREQHRETLLLANDASMNGDMAEAEKHWREYLRHVPNDPKVLFNMGVARQFAAKGLKDIAEINRLQGEAIGFYCDAIESPHPEPETKADCLNNQGLLLAKMGHPEKAKICFHIALQLWPEHRAARLNFADVLVFEGEYDAADKEFFEVINSDPQSAGAQFCRSMICLVTGDLKRGFRDYRARFKVASFPSKIMATDKPMWDGEPLDGKTLIITLEQGFGDHIQFIRYAGEIKKRYPASRVLFSVGDSMHRLLRGVVGLDGCLPDHLTPEFAAACPPFDYHAPLLHLPDICGTTLETIPGECPYILPQPDWIHLPLPE